MNQFLDLTVYLAALAAIGVGVAMKDAAWALVVVGAIVLATVFVSRFGAATPPPGDQAE